MIQTTGAKLPWESIGTSPNYVVPIKLSFNWHELIVEKPALYTILPRPQEGQYAGKIRGKSVVILNICLTLVCQVGCCEFKARCVIGPLLVTHPLLRFIEEWKQFAIRRDIEYEKPDTYIIVRRKASTVGNIG